MICLILFYYSPFSRLTQHFVINRRLFHSFLTMIIIIFTIIIFFILSSHSSSQVFVWAFHILRENIVFWSIKDIKRPISRRGPYRPICRSPSTGVFNQIFFQLKSFHLGYCIRYFYCSFLFRIIYTFVVGFPFLL